MSDPNPEIQKIQTRRRSPQKLSRREFLKLAGVAGTALAFKPVIDATADIWQPKVVDLGIEVLKNPAAVESILGSSASSLETLALRDRRAEGAPEITTNPSYRSMTEIIGEVLDRRHSEGKPVSYQRVAGYEDLPYYLDKLQKVAHDPANRDRVLTESGEVSASSYVLGYIPGAFENTTIYSENFFPEDVKSVFEMSHGNPQFSFELIQNESGFLDRTIETLGEKSLILLELNKRDILEYLEQAYVYWHTHGNEIDKIIRTYLQDIKQHIEKLVTQTEAPVSAGEIFSYCLSRNNGSITKSLMDTTLFLKYMARSDTTMDTFFEVKTQPEKARVNEDWFKRNIKDEYGKVGSYSELPHETYPYGGLLSAKPEVADLEVDKDLHLLNQIGKPYHAWNLVVNLTAVPPTIAQIGVAWRQLETFKSQGPIKTAADFRAALELNKLDSLFMMNI